MVECTHTIPPREISWKYNKRIWGLSSRTLAQQESCMMGQKGAKIRTRDSASEYVSKERGYGSMEEKVRDVLH